MYTGIPASPGIAIGKALVLTKKKVASEKKTVTDVTAEKNRFHQALNAAKAKLDQLIGQAYAEQQKETAAILETHRLILEDPDLLAKVETEITEKKVNAEFALEKALGFYIELLAGSDNAYFQERTADLKDVLSYVNPFLTGEEEIDPFPIKGKCILVAPELTPSDTARLPLNLVQGFITESGGPTSHTAIIARSLELPAVVGVARITAEVKNDDLLIIDGGEGTVLVNPAPETVETYRKKERALRAEREALSALKNAPARTKDGKTINLLANIGEPWELTKALEYGADGIGLYRTEYLFMNRDTLPTEEEQFEAYKEVLTKMEGKPVVIRTLDIGGDKNVPALGLAPESNPFLGYRAIRLCLADRNLFVTQLRALYRASVYGQLRIMFPLISSIEEYRSAVKIAGEVRLALIKEGRQIGCHVPLGIMVEVPSVALLADVFAKEVDFFSIGTNDLIQYTLAVDRMNERISHLYSPFHPAVLRLIKMVIDHARREGIEVSMCGEMAGDPRLTRLLIGLGLQSFSVSPSSLWTVKKEIMKVKTKPAKTFARKVLLQSTAAEIKEYIETKA